MELIQKLLLGSLPVYFYFVPNLLFPVFYRKYVKSAFYKIKGNSLNASEEIAELEKRMSRIIEFIGFLTTALVTLVAVIYDKNESIYFFNHAESLSSVIFFLGLTIITIINNFIQKFLVSPLNLYVEKFTVIFSAVLIYLFG